MPNKRASNPDNLSTAERVQLWSAPKDSTSFADWRSLGIAKGISINAENTALEHFSNYRGARAKDREIITERKLSFDFTLEEVNIDNLRLALGAGIADAPTSGTKDLKFDKTSANPGAGVPIALGQTAIKDLIIRSTSLEDDQTYDEGSIATDSTEDTADGSFNNTTSPLTVVGAVASYPSVAFAVGLFIKIENELLRVTAVDAGDVTFARAQLGTTVAAHADGENILVRTSGDYLKDLTNGFYATLIDGDLEDSDDVTHIHAAFQKAVTVQKFEIFPGETVEVQLQLQILGEGSMPVTYGPFEVATLKNNGAIPIGDGSDWEGIPMTAEITVDGSGTFGDGAVPDEGQIE